MLNHITIMGRLTRDPELRRTGSGIAVASFTVAVDRDIADKQSGERETDFIDCVAWRACGEFVSKYFTKGRMAVVSGRLQIRNWTDKDGNKRRSAEVVADNVYFGDSKREGADSAPNGAADPGVDPNGYTMPSGQYDSAAPAPGSYGAAPAPNTFAVNPIAGTYGAAPAPGGFAPEGYGGYGGYTGQEPF